MTFIETFGATSVTLLIAWIFRKYIEPMLDRSHEQIKNTLKTNPPNQHPQHDTSPLLNPTEGVCSNKNAQTRIKRRIHK